MNRGARQRSFVASLLNNYFQYGSLTEKQMNALRGVANQVVRQFLDNDLECQGAKPAKSQFLEMGNVISFEPVEPSKGEVLE